MSIQRLNARSIRRVRRAVEDERITRAWINNGVDHHVVLFATWDHRHGTWDRLSDEWWWDLEYGPEWHLTSCYDGAGGLLLELEPFEEGLDR